MPAHRTINNLSELDDVQGTPAVGKTLVFDGSNWTVSTPTISTITFTQSVASTTWVIAHNLNRFPSVTVVDSAGSTVGGNVTYNSANQMTLSFSAAFAGTAYLN